MSPRHTLRVSESAGVTVAHFAERHIRDEAQIQQLNEDLLGLADEEHNRLVLCFTDVETLSSSALGTLVSLHRKLSGLGGKLVLCGIRPSIEEAFVITRLNGLFTIVKSLPEALTACEPPAASE